MGGTIREVARLAAVSVTTASQALNGKGRVNAETRERVLRAAKQLGYAPNPQARALKTGKSMTLLAVLPGSELNSASLHSAYISDILSGAADQAIGAGYLLSIAGHAALSRSRLLNALLIDGVLFIDPRQNDPLISKFLADRTPVVTIGRPSDQPTVPIVENNYGEGMQRIFEHLRENGYRRPALLTTRTKVSYAIDSIEAFKRLSLEIGADRPLIRYSKGYPSIDSGAEATRSLLASELRPDVVIATTEPLALGAFQAFSERGLQMPDDIGLVSMTDSIRLASAQTAVTALDLRPTSVGRAAIQVLLQGIARAASMPRHTEVPTELFIRASTAKAQPAAGLDARRG